MTREVWSFLEIEDGGLHETAYKMASEARRTAKLFDAIPCGVLIGSYRSQMIEALQCYGLQKLYCFHCTEALSPEMITLVFNSSTETFNPFIILFANTPVGEEIGSRVAVTLQKGLIANCTDFEFENDKALARKSLYNGKVDALLTWNTPPPYLATIALSALEDVRTEQETQLEVVSEDVTPLPTRTTFINNWDVELSELDLNEARLVIGIGKGVDKTFMQSINKLSSLLNGVIGGTRIVVFSGLVPVDRLIGTTGKWLNCDAYIAIGVSGAPQHVMGIKGAKKIIAINIDKDAPIFKYAKLGVIGDLFQVVPNLINLYEAEQEKQL